VDSQSKDNHNRLTRHKRNPNNRTPSNRTNQFTARHEAATQIKIPTNAPNQILDPSHTRFNRHPTPTSQQNNRTKSDGKQSKLNASSTISLRCDAIYTGAALVHSHMHYARTATKASHPGKLDPSIYAPAMRPSSCMSTLAYALILDVHTSCGAVHMHPTLPSYQCTYRHPSANVHEDSYRWTARRKPHFAAIPHSHTECMND